MPSAASLVVLGPVIAFGVIAALAAVLRWAFDSDVARVQTRVLGAVEDFGLLRVAGVVATMAQARAAQRALAAVGIRATVAPAPDNRVRILVFEAQLEQARRVVGGPTC